MSEIDKEAKFVFKIAFTELRKLRRLGKEYRERVLGSYEEFEYRVREQMGPLWDEQFSPILRDIHKHLELSKKEWLTQRHKLKRKWRREIKMVLEELRDHATKHITTSYTRKTLERIHPGMGRCEGGEEATA